MAAFNSRDIDRMLAFLDPSIELHSVFAAVEGAVYRGHEGARRWHRDLTDAFGPQVRGDPEAYFDLGERTLVFYVLRGRGESSGLDVQIEAAMVIGWRDGRVAHFTAYAHRPDAVRDLGLSEAELEPIAP